MNLENYDHYVVLFSGGKDSTACLLHLLEQGIPRDRIELWHHDVDGMAERFMDWPITLGYCQAVADALGLPLYLSYKEGGFKREMNRKDAPTAPIWFQDEQWNWHSTGGKGKNNTRRKFPQITANLNQRWCSAYLKIDVGTAALKNQRRFEGKRTLTISGERAEESPSRAHYAEFEPDRADLRNGKKRQRHIDRARPLINMTNEEVWGYLQRWGINPHPAYWLGFGRVSCMSCIFGGADQFASVREMNPDGFQDLVDHERDFGVTMKRDTDLLSLAEKGEVLNPVKQNEGMRALAMQEHYDRNVFVETWQDPPGKYGENCGPS